MGVLTQAEAEEALAYVRAVHGLLNWAPGGLVPKHTAYRVGSQGGRVEWYFGVPDFGKKPETFSGGGGSGNSAQEQKVTPSPGKG